MAENVKFTKTKKEEKHAYIADFSFSVNNAFNELNKKNRSVKTSYSSWEITVELLGMHSDEYAPESFETFQSDFVNPVRNKFLEKTEHDWKLGVIDILDPSLFSDSTQFEIHGKLFILCLCELDQNLKNFLSKAEIYEEIAEKLTPPFDSLLPGNPDKRVILSDSAAYDDALGRNSFARAMSIWLDNNWQERPSNIQKNRDSKSFILHIGGPWGSGKSTLLNLIEKAFRCKDKKYADKIQEEPLDIKGDWIPVWFNAWRNQRNDPAWWILMDRITKESSKKLLRQYRKIWKYILIMFRGKAWRFLAGKTWYFLAFLLSVGVMLMLYRGIVDSNGQTNSKIVLEGFENISKAIGIVLTLFTTIWTAILSFGNSLVSGSPQSARHYIRQTSDPLEKLKKHFRRTINFYEKSNHPIIVFIDDLDRCNPDYVVDLTEGIQTIFTHSNLFFIIAADRRWIYKSFEKKYTDFGDKIKETGKELGYLFLEKAIQASVTVPRMDLNYKKRFLDTLYQYSPQDMSKKIQEAKDEYRDDIERMKDDNALSNFLEQNSSEDNPAMTEAIRQLSVEKSASREMSRTTEYFLREFAHLLEANPRAMKRFVNAYNIYKTLAYSVKPELISTVEKKRKFALWIILSIRWPILAELLEQEPGNLYVLENAQPIPNGVENWTPYVNNREIQYVIQGHDLNPPVRLESDDIEKLCTINPIVHKMNNTDILI